MHNLEFIEQIYEIKCDYYRILWSICFLHDSKLAQDQVTLLKWTMTVERLMTIVFITDFDMHAKA